MRQTDRVRTPERLARREDREQSRRQAFRQRIHAQAQLLRDASPFVAVPGIQAMVDYVERMSISPIGGCGLRHQDGKWIQHYHPSVAHRPAFRLAISPRGPADPCRFLPEWLEFENRVVTVVDCMISALGTFIVFSVIRKRASTSLVLESLGRVSHRNPDLRRADEVRILLRAEDDLFCAFDFRIEDLQGRPVSPTGHSFDVDEQQPAETLAMIVFDPFTGPIESFDILFLPPSSTLQDVVEPVAMRSLGAYVADATSQLAGMSLLVATRE